MSELRELYQQVILDHNRKPRNFRKLEGANRRAEGVNPLCGDQITLYLKVRDDVIEEATFEGSGCAISRAAASMMTASVAGKPTAEADALFHRVHAMLTAAPNGDAGDPPAGKLAQLWTVHKATDGHERPGELNWVHGMAVDSQGNIFAGDIIGQRVQKFVRRNPAE